MPLPLRQVIAGFLLLFSATEATAQTFRDTTWARTQVAFQVNGAIYEPVKLLLWDNTWFTAPTSPPAFNTFSGDIRVTPTSGIAFMVGLNENLKHERFEIKMHVGLMNRFGLGVAVNADRRMLYYDKRASSRPDPAYGNPTKTLMDYYQFRPLGIYLIPMYRLNKRHFSVWAELPLGYAIEGDNTFYFRTTPSSGQSKSYGFSAVLYQYQIRQFIQIQYTPVQLGKTSLGVQLNAMGSTGLSYAKTDLMTFTARKTNLVKEQSYFKNLRWSAGVVAKF